MPQYTVQSVRDALLVLTCFNYYHVSLSLVDLEVRTALPKSKVFRLLKTLEAMDFVVQEANGLYRLGPAALVLGRVTRASQPVRTGVDSIMQAIAHASRETINFATIQGKSLVYSAIIESPMPFRITERLGDIASWEHTALGLVILAHHANPRTFLPMERVRQLGPIFDRVRQQGYAIDDEATEVGVRCVGVSVRDGQGSIIGGCSLSAPSARLTLQQAHAYGKQLVQLAQDAEARIGEALRLGSDPIVQS